MKKNWHVERYIKSLHATMTQRERILWDGQRWTLIDRQKRIFMSKKQTREINGPSSSSVVTWVINARFLVNPQASPSGVSHGQSIPHCLKKEGKRETKFQTRKNSNASNLEKTKTKITLMVKWNHLAWLQCPWSTDLSSFFKLWRDPCHVAQSSNIWKSGKNLDETTLLQEFSIFN